MYHLIGPILNHQHPSRHLQRSAAHSQDVIPGSSLYNHVRQSCHFSMWRCAQRKACQPLLCPNLS